MLKRPDAKVAHISTAGQGADSPLGRLRARALSQFEVINDGAFTDARGGGRRMLEWSVPDGADMDNPVVVKAANPASRVTIEELREQREAVPDLAYRAITRTSGPPGKGTGYLREHLHHHLVTPEG